MPMLTGENGTAIGELAFFSDATQRHPLGTKAVTKDSRIYRYVLAGASTLVVGNMIQAPAQLTDAYDLAVQAAAAAGATSIAVTIGATNAIVAQQYSDGYALISVTPGLGYLYKIGSHPAAAINATLVLQLGDGETVQVALTTANSKVTLMPSPYGSVIQTPITTLTNAVVGACIYPIVNAQYGWIQTRGPAAVLIAGTPGAGLNVVCPGTSAGAVVIGAGATTPVVGWMMQTGVDGHVGNVFLTLD